jgi:hypothetical protein
MLIFLRKVLEIQLKFITYLYVCFLKFRTLFFFKFRNFIAQAPRGNPTPRRAIAVLTGNGNVVHPVPGLLRAETVVYEKSHSNAKTPKRRTEKLEKLQKAMQPLLSAHRKKMEKMLKSERRANRLTKNLQKKLPLNLLRGMLRKLKQNLALMTLRAGKVK